MSRNAQLPISRFQSLARTETAKIEGDWIVGRFAEKPLLIKDAGLVCTRIANLNDSPSAILEFTRKYGPLVNYSMLDPSRTKSAETFRFALSEWRAWRTAFRHNWKSVVEALGNNPSWEPDEKEWLFRQGSRVIFSRDETTLQLENFLDLINLSFGTLQWGSLRICAAVGCKTPYFVAVYPRERFCNSKECKLWNSRQRKKECWDRNKDRYIAKRK
jgi:hypothetical protein